MSEETTRKSSETKVLLVFNHILQWKIQTLKKSETKSCTDAIDRTSTDLKKSGTMRKGTTTSTLTKKK